MLFKEVIELWEDDVSEKTTISQFRGKINKYLNINEERTIEDALNENNMFDFIFTEDNHTARGKYNALYNIYKFYYQKVILKKEFEFPIKLNDVIEFDEETIYITKRNNYETVFLNEDFNLKELLNDKYYKHLNEEKAIITIKALISMALSTGLGKGELLKSKNNRKYLKVSDVNIIDKLQIKINVDSKNIKSIIIPEESSKYIIQYINIRNKKVTCNNAFFIKLWNGYDLNFDDSIVDRKPSKLENLVLYILKYISNALSVKELTINDLRANKVYQELIYSKGSALNEIIKLYGYVTFVEEVYQKFILNCDNDIYIGFDFFNLSSSSINEDNINIQKTKIKEDDEVVPQTYMSSIEKKKRNRYIVKQLKILYKNKCQICGNSIDMGNEIKYSEVHHIQPIGKEHNGIDNKHNMIVLCPNHHKMFDLGILAINPIDCKSIIHIDKKNLINNRKIEFKHLVSDICIRYHYEHIFMNLIKKLKK